MSIANNSLQGFLQVYAQESLQQFIATMPSMNLFTKNFDSEIANGGTAVTTRIPTTIFGAANDLTQGYGNTSASSSAVTATLKLRNHDMVFDELQWATITPNVIQKTYLPSLTKQLANSIVSDAISNVSSSYYTNTITVASSSLFTVTGSTSLLQAATTLSNLEIPEEGRYAIVTPNVYQSLVNGIFPTYVYGDKAAIQENKVQMLNGFELHKYARLYNATKPQGGASYSGGDKLIGIAGNSEGLVFAVRQPVEINNGLVQSATAVDETSGISVQVRLIYDVSEPAWRLVVVACYGVARGNASGIVPIITQSV